MWPKFLIQMCTELLQMNWHPLLLGCLADPFAQAVLQTCSELTTKRVRCSAGWGWMPEGEGQQLRASVYCCQCPVVSGEAWGNRSRGSTVTDRGPLETLCCSVAFATLALSFPLLGHVLYMSACSTSVINVAVLLMWGNSDHFSLRGLMARITAGAAQSLFLLLCFLVSFAKLITESAAPC